MSTTTKTNMLIGLEVKLLAGVLDAVPKLIEYLRRDMEKNYFMDVVFQGIEEENRLTSITADPETLTGIQFSLFEEGIPFERIRVSDHYADLFRMESEYVVLTRGSDYEKVLSVIERYKADHEKEEDEERAFPEGESDSKEEDKEEPAEEEAAWDEPEEEEDEITEDIDTGKKRKKRSDRAKRHRDRIEFPETTVMHHQKEELSDSSIGSFEEGDLPDDDRKLREAREREELYREERARRECLTPAQAYPSYEAGRDSTEPDSFGREDRLRSGSNDRTVSRERREVRETVSEEIEGPSANNGTVNAEDSGKPGVGTRRQERAPFPEWVNRKPDERKPEREADTPKEKPGENTSVPGEIKGSLEQGVATPGADRVSETAKAAPQAGLFRDWAFKNDKGKESTIHVGTEDILHRSERPGEASIRLDSLPGEAARKGHSLLEAREERPYSLSTVVSSAKTGNFARSAGSLAAEAALPRETEAGRFTHRVLDVASPTAAYIANKFMSQGVVAINSQIHFDKEIYLEAFAAAKHITVDEAAVFTEKAMKEFRKIDGVAFLNMAQLNDLSRSGKVESFYGMIRGMTKDDFVRFLDRAGISKKLWQEILKTPKGYLSDMSVLRRLEAFAETKTDFAFLAMLKGSVIDARFPDAPIGCAIKSLSRRLAFSAMGNSEGSRGLNSATSILSVMKTGYKAGMKAVTGISKKYWGADARITQTLRVLQSPVKHAARHTFKASMAKRSGQITGGTIKVKTVASRFASFQGRIASRFLGAKAGAGAAGVGTAGAATGTAAGAAAGSEAAVGAGAAAGGSAAAGGTAAAGTAGGAAATGATLSGGWIVAIVIVLAILVMALLSGVKSKDRSDVNMKPFNYADRTEIVAEVASELDQMNTEFNRQINDAANHRGTYAGVVSYQAGSAATEYEAYKVVFRDACGNELDPKTVDFNNTKAIVSMASQYIPFPFQKPSDNASKAEKDKYEGIKQYFKDYCSMLWAATHRIDIEEYYPGESGYDDASGMVTDRGACEEDGVTVWMPENMVPDFAPGSECENCTEDFNTGRGDTGHALCSHPSETYASTDGWKKTGRVVYHYNCKGHEITHDDSWTDEAGVLHQDIWYETVYCDSDKVYDITHKHASYEWEYVCGGHMSAVVYVTIGDVSRLSTMDAAGDVDYGAVGRYIVDSGN